eukprot:jgi/Picre1/30096/NNA_005465.t1
MAYGTRTRAPTECPLSVTVNKLVLSCKDYEDERSLKIAIDTFFISSTYSIQTIREEILRQFAPPAELDQVAYRILRLLPTPDDVTESICRENEVVDEATESMSKGDRSQDRLYQEMIMFLGRHRPYNTETKNLEPKDPTKLVREYQAQIVGNAGFSLEDHQAFQNLLKHADSFRRRLNPIYRAGREKTPATTYYKEYSRCFEISDPVGIKLMQRNADKPGEMEADNLPDSHIPFGTRMFMIDCTENDTGEKIFHKLGVCASACSFNGSKDSPCSCSGDQGACVLVEQVFEDPYSPVNEIVSPHADDEISIPCRPPASPPAGTYTNWPTHFLVKKITTIHEQYEQDAEMLRILDRDCQENVRPVFKVEDRLQQLREFVKFKKEQAGVDENSPYQCPRPIISGAGLESHCGKWLSSLIHQAIKGNEKGRMKAIRLLNNEVSIIMGRDINSNWFVKEQSKRGRKKKSEICPEPSADHITVKKKRGRKRKKSGHDRKALSELPINVYQQVKTTKNSGRAVNVPSRLRD